MPLRRALSCLFTTLAVALSAHAQATSAVGASVPGRFLVTYRSGQIPADAEASASRAGARLVKRHERLGMAILQSAPASAATARRLLAADPRVQFVVEDRIVTAGALLVRPASTPAAEAPDPDALYHSQQGWAVRQVGGYGEGAAHPGPWNQTQGAGVRIAILDSGVDAFHPDLAPNLVLNLTEIDQTALPSACDDGTPFDQQGHGTWTASLAAGALGPGTGLIAGVAPQSSILNIKVLERMPGTPTAADPTGCNSGQASGLLSWVIQGIEDAVAARADIVSMSLGTLVDITTGEGAGLKATFDAATHAAAASGTLLVAAAGNDAFNLANQQYIELPAQARDVLAVVATTNPACAENLASGASCAGGAITQSYYSNYGAPLNAVAAPGGSYPAGPTADPTQPTGWILSACSEGKPGTLSGAPVDAAHSLGCFGLGHAAYVQAMGTSASAPLVAGVAALILAAHPGWSAAEVQAQLRATAASLPGLAAGQVDANAANPLPDRHAYPIQVGGLGQLP